MIFKNQRGFTIIELIVVIAIISTLSSIVLVNVGKYLNSGKDAALKADFSTLEVVGAGYYDQNGTYQAGINDNICQSSDFARISSKETGFNCDYSINQWVACAPLPSNQNMAWCVDSTGTKGQVSSASCSSISASTLCVLSSNGGSNNSSGSNDTGGNISNYSSAIRTAFNNYYSQHNTFYAACMKDAYGSYYNSSELNQVSNSINSAGYMLACYESDETPNGLNCYAHTGSNDYLNTKWYAIVCNNNNLSDCSCEDSTGVTRTGTYNTFTSTGLNNCACQ
jgi:prepilin-type N-terminal cleavage/methylation domain-containing protein